MKKLVYGHDLMRIVPLFFLLAGAIGIFFLSRSTYLAPDSSPKLIPPPKYIEHLTFGYREVVADTLWLRVIQDFDTCENSDQNAKKKGCENSWVGVMLDRITDLAPKYKIAYVDGGTVLSVLLHDHPGAKKVFDKGLVQYPNDWNLAYRAAYHYMAELNNYPRASELLMIAFKNGGPDWLPALAGKLMRESGQLELAKQVLTDVLENYPDNPSRKRIEARLEEVEQALRKAKSSEEKK